MFIVFNNFKIEWEVWRMPEIFKVFDSISFIFFHKKGREELFVVAASKQKKKTTNNIAFSSAHRLSTSAKMSNSQIYSTYVIDILVRLFSTKPFSTSSPPSSCVVCYFVIWFFNAAVKMHRRWMQRQRKIISMTHDQTRFLCARDAIQRRQRVRNEGKNCAHISCERWQSHQVI